MQFFCLSPLIILAMRHSHRIGLLVWSVFMAAVIASPFAIAYENNFRLGMFDTLPGIVSDSAHGPNFSTMIEIKPYCRMAPYLIGILCAYTHRRLRWEQGGSMRMPRWMQLLGHAVSAAVFVLCVYTMTGGEGRLVHEASRFQSALWLSLCHVLWGTALAWLTVCILTGHARVADALLSAPWWLPLSRLTYSAYLVHPLVLDVFYGGLGSPPFYENSIAIYYYMGNVAFSYMCAAALWFAVERPLQNLETTFKRRG